MRLLYYRTTVPNFGDDLNGFLWPALAPDLFTEESREGFLGIGTIIGMDFGDIDRQHVFSSGVGYRPTKPDAEKRQIWCTRGPLSAQTLGVSSELALTDGAILSPLLYPKPQTTLGTVVMPHWETLIDNNEWETVCKSAGMTLVSPIGPVGEVIAKIASAKLVLTESLHGAIIADTFGVPWACFSTSQNFSLFKWTDWTRSVDLSLKVRVVPPPSGEVLLRFGMPRLGGWGTVLTSYDRQLAEETRKRVDPPAGKPKVAHGAQAPTDLKGRLKMAAKKTVLQTPALSRLIGVGLDRTAMQLRRMEEEGGHLLSSEAKRKELTDRMLTRLRELCRTKGVEPKY